MVLEMHRPAFLGERWFNQAQNMYSFEPCTADGTALPLETLDHLNASYWSCSHAFRWERGDVLLLDNEIATHARTSFTGKRKLFAAFTRE